MVHLFCLCVDCEFRLMSDPLEGDVRLFIRRTAATMTAEGFGPSISNPYYSCPSGEEEEKEKGKEEALSWRNDDFKREEGFSLSLSFVVLLVECMTLAVGIYRSSSFSSAAGALRTAVQ